MVSEVRDAIRLGAHMDPSKWVSHKSGRITPIEDMKDEHLLASINMLERGYDIYGDIVPDWCRNKAPTLVLEAEKRGILGRYKPKNAVRDGWDA